LCFSMLFFFQAEDGIRDLIVTGVQTCALPISHRLHLHLLVIEVAQLRAYRRSSHFARLPDFFQRDSGAVNDWAGPHDDLIVFREIGRASCRERGEVWVVAGVVETKRTEGDI